MRYLFLQVQTKQLERQLEVQQEVQLEQQPQVQLGLPLEAL